MVVEEGEGGEEDAVGDGRMSSFRLRLVSIYPLAPILQPLSPPQREGGVVVGGDERRFYTDDSYIIFAALHVGQGQGVGTRSRSGAVSRFSAPATGASTSRAPERVSSLSSGCTRTCPAAGSMVARVPMVSLVRPGGGAMRGVRTRCVGLSISCYCPWTMTDKNKNKLSRS